jgi:hypothetical protein
MTTTIEKIDLSSQGSYMQAQVQPIHYDNKNIYSFTFLNLKSAVEKSSRTLYLNLRHGRKK